MSFYPYDYKSAADYFEGARDRYRGRPLQNNTRLVEASDYDLDGNRVDAFAVRLHNTNVVTYLPGGLVKLNHGGWPTVTTQDRINGWSPARVYSDFDWKPDGTKGSHGYKRWVVDTHVLGTTVPKVQRCRRCRGEGETISVQTHYQSADTGWKQVPLDEPVETAHVCWGCSGTGKRDYGSHKIHPAFYNGIIVDQQGQVVSKLAVSP